MNLHTIINQLKQERARLDSAIRALEGVNSDARSSVKHTGRKMSAAARARIAAAQRERWRKVKAGKSQAQNGAKRPKRIVSAATRRKLAAVQRARWAKVKAGKKAA